MIWGRTSSVNVAVHRSFTATRVIIRVTPYYFEGKLGRHALPHQSQQRYCRQKQRQGQGHRLQSSGEVEQHGACADRLLLNSS